MNILCDKLLLFCHKFFLKHLIIYINSLSLSICDERIGHKHEHKWKLGTDWAYTDWARTNCVQTSHVLTSTFKTTKIDRFSKILTHVNQFGHFLMQFSATHINYFFCGNNTHIHHISKVWTKSVHRMSYIPHIIPFATFYGKWYLLDVVWIL